MSLISMSLVKCGGTDALRWTEWNIKGAPMAPPATVSLSAR